MSLLTPNLLEEKGATLYNDIDEVPELIEYEFTIVVLSSIQVVTPLVNEAPRALLLVELQNQGLVGPVGCHSILTRRC